MFSIDIPWIAAVASFAKEPGGNIKVTLGKFLVWVMPREYFRKSLQAANAFNEELVREEATEYIATLPQGPPRKRAASG